MKNEKIAAIKKYTQVVMEKDQTGHGIDHINRVVRLANQIAETETCDLFIITAAAYLHDIADDKLVADSEYAYQQLEQFLREIHSSDNQIQQIIHIIKNLSFSQELVGTA